MRVLTLLIASLTFAVSACSSSPEEGCGELVVSAERVEFGEVIAGQSATRQLELKNVGACPAVIERIEHDSGDPTRVAPLGVGEEWTFRLDLATWRIEPGQSVPVQIVFRSPCHQADAYRSAVVFHGRAGERASLDLFGLPLVGVCEAPTEIDFGAVAVGDVARASYKLENPSDHPATFMVTAPPEGSPFSLADDSPRGAVELAPHTEREITFEFRPTEVDEAQLELGLGACSCLPTDVHLVGRGLGVLLTWVPSVIDFKYVPPGATVTKSITLSNSSTSEVQLSQIKLLNVQEFWVVAAEGEDPTRLSIPGATTGADRQWTPGIAKLTVAFKPVQVGPRQTQLQFQTSLASQPTGMVILKGFGGGPDIQVTPSPTLNFGKVAYFAGTHSFQKRKLTIMNVGTVPAVSDPEANLRLGKDAGNGDWTGPYFEIVSTNADTAPGDFEIIIPPNYDPRGLEPRAPGNRTDFEVVITPQSVGLKQATLRIFSNDPDEPVVEILLSADAVNLPPCSYTVTPPSLGFGVVSTGEYRDLSFTITNDGTGPGDLCLLTGLDLVSGSNAAFMLPDGPIDAIELAPGKSERVTVRVHAQGQPPVGVTSISGMVEFFMSSPTLPRVLVTLIAQLAPPCLTVLPDTVDFGTAAPACSSEARTLHVWNTCATPIWVTGVSLPNGAGQPPGAASCPGPSACPEFHLAQTPSIPLGGSPLVAGDPPLAIEVRYEPLDTGSDHGALAVEATWSGTYVTRVVPLHGRGDALGLHSFDAPGPRLDLLFVFQPGPNMPTHQAALAQAVPGFLQYAAAKQLDFRIGVTNTYWDGELLYGGTHPERILTASTANLATKLAAKLQESSPTATGKSCLDAALRAVIPTLSNGSNAGFPRPGVPLAIVCVSDELDRPLNASPFYVDAFFSRFGNRKQQFAFHAVNGFSKSCQIDDGTLASVASLQADICAVNWTDFLEDVIDDGEEATRSFELTSDVEIGAAPLTVSVNGSPVSPTTTGGVTAWSHDVAANQIVFDSLASPVAGDSIAVTYPVMCHP